MPRFRRSRRRSGRRTKRFKRLARRIVRAGVQPRRLEIADMVGGNLQNGDGTSRVVGIYNIPSNLIQGDSEDRFTGNSVYLKGLGIAGSISIPNASFHSFYVRFTLFHSRQNATGMTGLGAQYNSTTTDSVQPAQAGQFRNPRIFAFTTGAEAWVGGTMASLFDTTSISHIKSKIVKVNPGGASECLTRFKFYFKINRKFEFYNPDDSPLTVIPNHGKYGSWYLISQVFGPLNGTAGNQSNTVVGTIDKRIVLYWRDT